MIEVRPPTTEELEPMLRLMCEAFHLPYGPARELFYRDPYFSLENKRVLVRDGAVVSCLTLTDALMWIGAARVTIAGIANVCTSEAERGKGFGRRLLADTVADLRNRGVPFAGLLPYSYGYYHRLGWELCSTGFRFTAPPAALPPFAEARHVRPGRPEDVSLIAEVYSRHSEGRTGFCIRDAKRWEHLTSYSGQQVIYSHGEVKGYMLYDIVGMDKPRRTLKVLEMVADAPEGYRGFVGFLCGHAADVEAVEYSTSWDQLAAAGLAEIVLDADAHHAVRIEQAPGMMLRVVDLACALEAISPKFRGWSGELALACTDPLQGEAAVLIKAAGHGVVVEPCSHSPRGVPLIAGSVQAWAQVLTGYLSLADALSLHRLSVAAGRAGERIQRLFPRRHPYLPVPDHF